MADRLAERRGEFHCGACNRTFESDDWPDVSPCCGSDDVVIVLSDEAGQPKGSGA